MKRLTQMLFGALLSSQLIACTATTDSTEVGVRVVNLTLLGSRGVQAEVYPQGSTFFFFRPTSDFYTFDIGIQNLVMVRDPREGDRTGDDSLQFKTVDGNDVSVNVTVAWSVIPEKTPYLLQFVGQNEAEVEETLVRPVARAMIRDVLNQLSSEEYYQASRRFEMAEEARRRLVEVLEPEGINIQQVLLGEHKFNTTYETIIRDKKVAEQEAERLVSETEAAAEEKIRDLERAKGSVSQAIEKARGEAAQRQLEADSIYFEREQQARAILAEKRALAEGLTKQAQALSGSGGERMVKLEFARTLQGKKILFVPAGTGMDLRSTDMNALLQTYGVKTLAE